ncbi:hypothetical protein J6590_068527 [Homalodisca vitripennis]|nr:hypothetical protein J6590_068527 [Homalodisca vitripennis]
MLLTSHVVQLIDIQSVFVINLSHRQLSIYFLGGSYIPRWGAYRTLLVRQKKRRGSDAERGKITWPSEGSKERMACKAESTPSSGEHLKLSHWSSPQTTLNGLFWMQTILLNE